MTAVTDKTNINFKSFLYENRHMAILVASVVLLMIPAGIGFYQSRQAWERPILPFRISLAFPIIITFLIGALSLGVPKIAAFWQNLIEKNYRYAWVYPLGIYLLYIAFALPTKQFREWESTRLIVYITIPIILALFKQLWADWLIGIAVWLPIQYKWLSLPQMPVENGGMPSETLVALTIAFWALIAVRKLPGFAFRWEMPWDDVKLGLKLFAIFGVIAVPIGVISGFLSWRPFTLHNMMNLPDWAIYLTPLLYFVLLPLGMYFSVALVEEALFRGIIQNLLAQTLRLPWLALILSSALFGMVHMKGNTSVAWHLYAYTVFAAVAGGFYGYAYIKTGRLSAGAVAHTLINSMWLMLFNPWLDIKRM